MPPQRILLGVTAFLATSALTFGGVVDAQASTAPPLASTVSPASQERLTDLVDPFVSTEDDFGQDLPGAVAPHSLIKINPLTADRRSHSGYDYAAKKIAGFTHTNLDGVGGSGGGGDLLIVPTYVEYTTRPSTASYAKSFSHEAEEASPGYYRVDLATTQGKDSAVSDAVGVGPIVAEATASVRSGQDRFTFPKRGEASLVFDVANNFTDRRDASLTTTVLPDGRVSLAGHVVGFFNGYEYGLHYYAETTDAATSVRTWGGDRSLSSTTTRRQGTDIGAIATFDVEAGQQIGMKVAISTISAEQAKIDLDVEMGSRTFDEIRTETSDAWEQMLGRVRIDTSAQSDPDGTLSQLFYTHMYRMLGSPVNATSTSGTYRGVDGSIREARGYTHYDGWGFWDDFRKYEVLAMTHPDLYADMAQSIVDLYETFTDSGASRINQVRHSVPTVRFERAAVVVADALAKGVQLDGLANAWPGLLRESAGGYSDSQNVELGYIRDRADNTLGTAYDDWAMAAIARALGHDDEAAALQQRATNWTNIFKDDAVTLPNGAKVGLNTPRRADGTFQDVDPEAFQAGGLYQGTLWQYHWYMAPDMGGLIEMMGGEENTLAALSFMFGEHAPDDGSRMLHSNANEIDLQTPYLFNYVGAPAKTQYWARNIYAGKTWNRYIGTNSTSFAPSGNGEFTPPQKVSVYNLAPRGFLPTMDNDTGTMSSMFVSAALGLFPVQAGSAEYQIGSPFFERTSITYPSGRTFTIAADAPSAESFYIQSATLNGASFDRTWVTHQQMMAGGELSFEMDSAPSEWAADSVAPPSLSDVVDSSIYARDSGITIDAREFHESSAGDGSIENTITVSLSEGRFAGVDGDDLARTIEVENLPSGLTLSAVRTGDRSLALTLNGRADAADDADSIDDLRLTLTRAAFSSAPTGSLTVPSIKVTFAGVMLAADSFRIAADAAGVVDSSVRLTLNGARFAGADGRELVASGDLALRQLPAGLTAEAVKVAPSVVQLRVYGTLSDVATTKFTLAFTDGAFEGVVSTAVGGAAVALNAFTVAADPQWRARLSALYDQTKHIVKGSYTSASFAEFDAARTAALGTIDDVAASDESLETAHRLLEQAVSQLRLVQSAYRTLQFEENDSWSGGALNRESSKDAQGVSLGNIGGVGPDSWVRFDDLDFGDDLPEEIAVRYVNNSTRSPADSRIELRLDAVDGPVLDTIATPATGSNWSAYETVTHTLTQPGALEGSHTVYAVFRGATTDSRPWIGNFDWMQFVSAEASTDRPSVRIEAEAYTASNEGGLKKESGTDEAGVALGNVGGTWDGGRLEYPSVDLTDREYGSVTVRYVNNSGRTGPDARLELRFDDPSSEVIATVPLPATGTNWRAYREVTIDLPAGVTGTHTLYVTTRASTTAALPFVANLDWFQFGGADFSALRTGIAEAEQLLEFGERYIPADWAVFVRALDSATATAGDARAVQADVDEALRMLKSAQRQLVWVVVYQLSDLIDTSRQLDTSGFTAATVAVFEGALQRAEAVTEGAGYQSYRDAHDGLRAAIDGLVEPTVPARPATPDAALTGPAQVTVTWGEVADDGGSPITGFTVTLTAAGESPRVIQADGADRSAVFSGLTSATAYTATVAATNARGAGADSESSAPVTTEAPPAPPVADGDDLPEDAQGAVPIEVADGVATVRGLQPHEWYFLYVYSAPTEIGWFQADGSGTIRAELPRTLEAGVHRLAVVDAGGELIGWAEFTIAKTETPGTTTPPPGGLATTGVEGAASAPLAGYAALAVLGGLFLLVFWRRRLGSNREVQPGA